MCTVLFFSSAECQYRLSRNGLTVAPITTVYPRVFEGSPNQAFVAVASNHRQPIVRGSPETNLPEGCSVSGAAMLTSKGFSSLQSPHFSITVTNGLSYLMVRGRD